MQHQASKSLADFSSRLIKLPFARGHATLAPQVPFVLRVGLAGPLSMPNELHLAKTLSEILCAIDAYSQGASSRFSKALFPRHANPPPARQLRLVCSLAAGFDQLGASCAVELGYAVHAVLPGDRQSFEHDIRRNAPEAQPAGSGTAEIAAVIGLRRLLSSCERVLELDRDGDADPDSAFTFDDYRQAASIILGHSDLIVVAVHDEPFAHPGGSRWLAEQADEHEVPVVRIPITRPNACELSWTQNGVRQVVLLRPSDGDGVDLGRLEAALESRVVGEPFHKEALTVGWLETRYASLLDSQRNAAEWDQRWEAPELGVEVLADACGEIDADFRAAKVWADHQASGQAELVRGSFIFSAMLGLGAVSGALTGLLDHHLGLYGKGLEVICLGMMFVTIERARRFSWTSRWLGLRQLERSIDQAAWLHLLGRSHIYPRMAHTDHIRVDDATRWTNNYLCALARASAFPSVRLTPEYRVAAHRLLVEHYLKRQIDYFSSERQLQGRSEDVLARWIERCVVLAGAVTGIYLLTAAVLAALSWLGGVVGWLGPLASAAHTVARIMPTAATFAATLGVFLPCLVAFLAAVRSYGEYEQLAIRYGHVHAALDRLRGFLAARLPDPHRPLCRTVIRSRLLADKTEAATNLLFQEVVDWRSILQTKAIEPS